MIKVCDIYTAVTANKPRTMKLTIVRQRDKLEIVSKVIFWVIFTVYFTWCSPFSAFPLWGSVHCQWKPLLLCWLPLPYAQGDFNTTLCFDPKIPYLCAFLSKLPRPNCLFKLPLFQEIRAMLSWGDYDISDKLEHLLKPVSRAGNGHSWLWAIWTS